MDFSDHTYYILCTSQNICICTSLFKFSSIQFLRIFQRLVKLLHGIAFLLLYIKYSCEYNNNITKTWWKCKNFVDYKTVYELIVDSNSNLNSSLYFTIKLVFGCMFCTIEYVRVWACFSLIFSHFDEIFAESTSECGHLNPHFPQECRCCRESFLSERMIVLNQCYNPDGIRLTEDKMNAMEVFIKEPAQCECYKCGDFSR